MKISELLDTIFRVDEASAANASPTVRLAPPSWSGQFGWLAPDEIRAFLQKVSAHSDRLREHFTQITVESLATSILRQPDLEGVLNVDEIEILRDVYLETPVGAHLRGVWLQWLVQAGSRHALGVFLDLIGNDPPGNEKAIAETLTLLVGRSDLNEAFYSKLLENGLRHRRLAVIILEVINFRFRTGKFARHPARDRASTLSTLLAQTVTELRRIEAGQLPAATPPDQIRQSVADGIALVVALCDTLAQCEYPAAADPLLEAATLQHRHIQTEASAALARLGVTAGRNRLVELASEPISRLRVLNYADELNLLDEIADDHKSDLAIAEAKLATWLADPIRFGVAPSELKLIDCREYYWPSFEHPVLCYLFRFCYGLGENAYQNFGLVGPLVHAFSEDITWLEFDDVYAAFAGYQAEHEEIYELPATAAFESQPNEINRRLEQLESRSYERIQPALLGHFLGEWILVATAENEGVRGYVMADGIQIHWFGQSEDHSVSVEFAYMVYKGRRMLRTFNS